MEQIPKLRLSCDESSVGSRVDKFLGSYPEIGSRSRAAYLIEAQKVLINQKPAKTSSVLKLNDVIEVEIEAVSDSTEIKPLALKLDILFEDDDLIVLNKPAGLVVHPAAGHADDTLVNALIHHTPNLSMKFGENRPGIVHRLDRDTSGVMVVAKNDFAHEALTAQFKDRSIHRIYFAVCFGKFKNKKGRIEGYLARHPTDRKRYASCESEAGKWSATNYEVLAEEGTEFSLVRLKLETGRTHQIRVHMSELGHPIVGDKLYGSDKKLKSIKSASKREEIKEMTRFSLHAAELGFTHPRTGEKLFFSTEIPFWVPGQEK